MRRPQIRRFLLHGDNPVGWITEGHRCWAYRNEPPESRAFACPECGLSWRRWFDGSWHEQPWLEPPSRRVEFLVGARSGMFNDEALFLGGVADWPFKAVRCHDDEVTEHYTGAHGEPLRRFVPSGRFNVGIMGDHGQTLCGEGMTFCTVAENLGIELTDLGVLLPPLPARMPPDIRRAAHQST